MEKVPKTPWPRRVITSLTNIRMIENFLTDIEPLYGHRAKKRNEVN